MGRSKKIQSVLLRSKNKLKKFRQLEDGAAVIEFALVLPVFMILISMFAIAARGELLSTQVEQTAATVSDIIAQSDSMSTNEVDAAMRAGEAIAGTETAQQVKLGVIGVKIKSGNRSEVIWTRTLNGATVPAVGSTNYPMPAGLLDEPGFIVVSEASLEYIPTIGSNLTGPIPLSSKHYFVPRNGAQSSCSGCNP